MIYSASSIWAQYKYNDQFKYIKAQILFFIIGLILMYILSKIDYKIYEHKANKILLVCFILLCLSIKLKQIKPPAKQVRIEKSTAQQ